MFDTLTDEQWQQYETQGYLRLGKVLSDEELATLQQRMDDIMLGRAPLDYDRMLMQLDREPGTGKMGPQTKGHKGATLSYRKIQDLEFDPLFLAYMRKPLFRHICDRVYGENTDIACFRAMFMNKPAKEGSHLRWHQDRWNYLDRDPLITIWTALDPATIENGCVQIAAGTHHRLYNPSSRSGHLEDEQAEELLKEAEVVHLELAAGEGVLLHNHLPHSSEVNTTEIPRRAFSACYMDAATQTTSGETYSILFGDDALELEAANI
ncbi:phytanoyl-CoA dioxygenase family protein [Chloroflexi bacterium TSY]|nr:phytanoyl-CoA dioxygenase family protein [Chloroflexi bacterium TSY]